MSQKKKNKIKNIFLLILSISIVLLGLDRAHIYINQQQTESNNIYIDRTVGECLIQVTNMKYACGDFCPELFRIDRVLKCEGDSLFFINKEMTIIFQEEGLKNKVELNMNNRFIFEGRIQSNNLGLLRMLVSNVVPIEDSTRISWKD